MLGCENTVIEGVDWRHDDAGDSGGPRLTVVASVRPYTRQGAGSDVRDADVADLAGLLQFDERPQAVLVGHGRAGHMKLIQVDVVAPQC
jgi:hypothetical protein